MAQSAVEETIQALLHSIQASNQCFSKSLQEEDLHRFTECIRLTRECAEVCTLALHALQTESGFTKPIAALCAQVCDTCAVECGRHTHDHCVACAEACTRTAEACRSLAAI